MYSNDDKKVGARMWLEKRPSAAETKERVFWRQNSLISCIVIEFDLQL